MNAGDVFSQRRAETLKTSPHPRPSDGTLVNPLPPTPQSECLLMKQDQTIPFYAQDGRSLGFRTLESAERLVAT